LFACVDVLDSYAQHLLEWCDEIFGCRFLVASLTCGFTPTAGNTFDPLDWGRLAGAFSTLTLSTLPADVDQWKVDFARHAAARRRQWAGPRGRRSFFSHSGRNPGLSTPAVSANPSVRELAMGCCSCLPPADISD
jgi:hypothetical protein